MKDIVIGERVRNKQGEIGTIVAADDKSITVAYENRQAKLLANAFENGYLRYEDSDLQYFIDADIKEVEDEKRRREEEALRAKEAAREACRKMEAKSLPGITFNSVSIRLDPVPVSLNSVKTRHKNTVQEIFDACDKDARDYFEEFDPKMKYVRETKSYVYYGRSSYRSRYCTAFLCQYSGEYVMRVFSRNDIYKPGVMGGFTVTNSDTTEIIRIISIGNDTYYFSKNLSQSGISYMNTTCYNKWHSTELNNCVNLDKIVKKCDCGYLDSYIEQENVDCFGYARTLIAAIFDDKAEIVFKHKIYHAMNDVKDIVGYLEQFSPKQIDFACRNNVLDVLPIIKSQGLYDTDILQRLNSMMENRRNGVSLYEALTRLFDQFNLDSSVMDKRLISFLRRADNFNVIIYRDYIYDLSRLEVVTIDDVFDRNYEERHYIMLNERRVYYPKAICEAYANEAKELSWIDREENGYFVIVPKSVLEIKEEGDYQHHCVYTNGYVNDVIAHESVIVFLRKEKEIPLVTIEFDYNTFEVLQARGRYNQTPDYKARQYIKLLSETLNREKTSRE
jgi:hypothetical protein